MQSGLSVALLNDSFPPLIDGVANAVVNYGRNIPKFGGSACVVTPANPEAEDESFPFPVLRYPSIDVRKLVGYYAGFPFSPELRGKLPPVDILHSHCPVVSTMLARELRSTVDAPVILTYHTKFDVDIAGAIRGKLLQEGAIRALVENISACDEVWAVSRGAGENLRSIGYEGEYIVMENGVDMERGRASAEAVRDACAGYDLPAEVPTFLFVGRLMWYKGLRLVLDGLKLLSDAGQEFRFVIIGGGGNEEEIRQYVRERGLADRVFFTGAIRDRQTLRAWYTRADLFLFPSTYDTNGLVVREAAACSLASVLVRGSCAAEGVTDCENGFLIEETAESLFPVLQKLCRNRELCRRLGENACRELYLSWGEAVGKAYERYEIVSDRYRSGGYPRHRRPMDHFFRGAGELMEFFGKMEKGPVHRLVRETEEALRQNYDRYL